MLRNKSEDKILFYIGQVHLSLAKLLIYGTTLLNIALYNPYIQSALKYFDHSHSCLSQKQMNIQLKFRRLENLSDINYTICFLPFFKVPLIL